MHALDVLGDPVRRRILELLADAEPAEDAPEGAARELAAGDVVEVIGREFGIGQPAVSMQLKVLREHGFATVRPDGRRRLYAVAPDPLREVEQWLAPFRAFWEQRLDALDTEIRRGLREQRSTGAD